MSLQKSQPLPGVWWILFQATLYNSLNVGYCNQIYLLLELNDIKPYPQGIRFPEILIHPCLLLYIGCTEMAVFQIELEI